MIRPVGGLNEYRYTIADMTVTVKNSSESYVILSKNIQSIAIGHSYVENIIPIIRVSAAVEKDLYKLLTSSEKDLSVQLILHKYIKNSDIQAKELVFSKIFSVLNEYDLQPDEMKMLYGDEENTDQSISGANTQQLVEASFYLIDKVKLTNYRKVKSFSFSNASLTDTIAAMFWSRGFRELLMNKIPTDRPGKVIVPAYNLLSSLDYVNNRYGIFNTDYIFYMDINENYLIDKISLGKAVRENRPSMVNLYLEEFSSVESAEIGSIIHNDAHVINLVQPPVVEKFDNYTELLDGTALTGVDMYGNVTKIAGEEGSNERTVWAYNKKILNQIRENALEVKYKLGVNFLNIDITALAPNLLYNIVSHSSYNNINNINGKYRLNEANIIFTKETDDDFLLRCTGMLIRLP